MANNVEVIPFATQENERDGAHNCHEQTSSFCPPPNKRDEQATTSNTMRLCKIIVARPKFAFGVALSVHVVLLLLTGGLLISGYDILPVNFGELPLDLPKDPTKLRADAWIYATENEEISSLSTDQLARGNEHIPINLFYGAENVFTQKNLQIIKDFEDILFSNSDYQNEFCLLQGTGTMDRRCAKPLSILRFFDGTYSAIDATFYDPNFENIPKVLYAAIMNRKSSAILNFHLAKDSRISATEAISSYTRTLLPVGLPLEGYHSSNDRKQEQKHKLDEMIVNTFRTIFEQSYDHGIKGINFIYFHQSLFTAALQSQIIYDMMLAVASLCFIFIFCWFQTGSLWITFWGVFSIFSSFNITNLLYRIILDFRYFGIFHVMSVFIILGIGSDDIFVFLDTWKQSYYLKYESCAHRLSDVYRKSAKTMFVTTITTVVAFLSNAPSPLLAISSFGIFSALLVFVNYLSTILFFPTVLVYHHFERSGYCCCFAFKCLQSSESDKNESDNDQRLFPTKRKSVLDSVIWFFQGWFFEKIVTQKYVRWLILIVFGVTITTAVVFATKLVPAKEQTKVWRSDTNWAKYNVLNNNVFRSSQEDYVVVVNIIWGLKEQDRSECHHTDFKCKGTTVFDQSFDINPPPCQISMLNLCKSLKHATSEDARKLRLRRNDVTGEFEIICVFERMNQYLKEEAKKRKYPNNSDFSFVVNANKMHTLMENNKDLYNVSLFSDSYFRYFEVGLGYFITDGGSRDYSNSFDFKKYHSFLGTAHFPTLSRNASRNAYLQGKMHDYRLMYVSIAVNTTLSVSSLGYQEGLPIYRNWENFVSTKMKDFPSSCKNAFQATVYQDFNVWHWVKVQEILVLNALTGIIVGITLSLVILVLMTTNVYIGIIAALTMAMITTSVLGVISMIGWTLGPLESLNLTLVVGLAVDYVVHLAEGYIQAVERTRTNKVRYALSHVGVSVLSGACSTLGASIFMLAAKILFFVQFGIFIFATIGFSILYSLFLFPTVMAWIGPEGKTGSLLPLWKSLKEVFRGQTNKHTDCVYCDGKGFYTKGTCDGFSGKETHDL